MEERLQQGHPGAYALLQGLDFCVIDLETTGGDHKYDKIIEIGLVKINKLKITDELSFLVRPEIAIPEFVQRLTSIHERDIKESPVIESVIDQVVDFIGEKSVLVAHNASFDIPFLNSVLKRLGRPLLKNPTLCTNMMTKYLIPEIMNSNLPYIGDLFGLSHKNAHRALEDARVTAQLLIGYLHFFIAKDIKKINHLYYPRRKYELNTVHFENKEGVIKSIEEKLLPITTPLEMIVKGLEGRPLALLPLKNPVQEKDNCLKFLNEVGEWSSVTFKMVGHFVEAIFSLGDYFPRFQEDSRQKHLTYLYENHPNIVKGSSINLDHFQFLMIPHLIPEQYRIYSLMLEGIKGQMIFRYPGHQKKLSLFFTHQLRNPVAKGRMIPITREMKSFCGEYLQSISQTDQFLLLVADDINKSFELKKKLQNYVDNISRTNNTDKMKMYPRQHI